MEVKEDEGSERGAATTPITVTDVVSFLRSLSPSKVEEHKELCDEGVRLFSRMIKKSIFQDEGMQTFWREHKKTLKKLEKVFGN
jgi:hypothetical protein